ncbi:MAG TPA: excinuclease ABC subunit UvrA, partial [Chlamydiales bacterium]|nr:excinuclease ABC subunit UvrA [Chlamydiales bacterium]
ATYIKLFDDIRELFAQLPESKLRGFTAAHFSFNVKEGSCTYCGGLGKVRVDMDFMEDAELECPQCRGRRFDPEILAVEFKGYNISDILNLDVEHALPLFDALPQIRKKLEVLSQVGLDYLTLGQPSTTLSGGEAQRIKLAKELVRPATGRTLYILDEPTTGLHFHDVARLSTVLQKLVDKGNTVLIIEHNMDLVKTADWVLELGPKAGAEGGQIVAEGTPAAIAKKKTATGAALRRKDAKLLEQTATTAMGEMQTIRVENAQQNNLKGFDLEIPRGKITVFTGPSGSGKSSLAFETIYAEGQRRYTETLPSYARQTIKQLPKPKVDRIVGLSPSIALEQKTGGLNPRSTVGTMTEIYDLLRVLYAHLGTPFCPETGEEIRNISKEYVVQKLLERPLGEKMHILSPLVLQKKETFPEMCERLSKQGFIRIRLNGVYYELDQKIPFENVRKNEIFLVIDRMAADPKNEQRLFEAVEKATLLSNGSVSVDLQHTLLYFNLSFAVESTGKSYPSITPQTFSFNAEAGMCQECQGLGMTYGARLEENQDFQKKSIMSLCDRLFKDRGTSEAYTFVEEYFKKAGVDVDAKKISPDSLSVLLNGGPEFKMKKGLTVRWVGIQTALASIARMAKRTIREDLLPLLTTNTCPSCQGARLNPLARAVKIKNTSLPALCHLSITEADQFMKQLETPPFLTETHGQIIKSFEFLLSIGVSYLSLDRSAPTLSGGEIQRIRLARQLGSGLTSCLYVLDEPTIGLHPYNNQLLNVALKKLCDHGNTLLLVEHDPLTVLEADFLVDFGPKAGAEGGYVTASGTIEEILQNPNSLTGDYLSGRKKIPIPKKRRPFSPDITIEHASLHNLTDVSVAFPRSAITCLTGVSGSGKSTLMRHLLKPAAEKCALKHLGTLEYLGATFTGLSFEKVICIDQSPIGQTSRADVSTYTDIQPLLRSHFASLPGAKMKGLQGRHFSPNHRRGMCPTCWGMGYKTVDLQYLPAVRIPCPACHGYRLNPISLEVRYKGKNLGQVLEMSVEAALHWFSEIPRITKRLQTLCSVGLAYLKLGQEIASLSGGEAQRLRLSRELAKRETGNTLYLIDEPTVGLHSEDIARLLPIFHRLADKKNTLVIIEHNLDVIANADYVIDIGPDAGLLGGKIMAKGTPEEVAKSKKSRTAPFLKERLSEK